jgi:myo-inositol 2-dehydrogenase/D-chiro-inositol 1-dehydrogenase
MVQPIRLGLIGCGSIARGAHLPAIDYLADQVSLVAVADVDPAAASIAAKKWGADVYADYRALLDRADIAAVIVATPEYLHAEQVTAAAAAGKHVLCEKPIARTLEEADRMIDACARAGVQLMVGHSRRFSSRYIEIKTALDSGAIGQVMLARENERRSRAFGGNLGGRWTPQHWSGNPQLSGGVALLAGIHEADLLRWFIGAEPVSVYAQHMVTMEDNVGVPDFLTFTVRFSNGAIGSSEITRLPPASYPAFHQLELYGTTGAIRAKDHDLIGIVHYTETGAQFPAAEEILLRNVVAYSRQLGEFLAAIREGRPVPMPPVEARRALAIALATIESARSGQVVDCRGSAVGAAA